MLIYTLNLYLIGGFDFTMSISKEEIIKKVHELIEAPSCCAEAKEAGNNFLKALGTPDEKSAAQALIKELDEDVTSVDGLIAFAESDNGKAYFGEEKAKNLADAAHKAKDAGGKYCICAACTAGGAILDNKAAIL